MTIDLSIIIVNRNTKELLHSCLDSIFRQPAKYSFEVIVIDNGSGDSSAEMVKRSFPRIKLIQNNSNLGFAKANNQGIELAIGGYILLLNSDTEVLNGALEKMIQGMDAHKNFGACTSKIINPDKTLQSKGRNLPNLAELFLKLFLPNKIYAVITGVLFELFQREQKGILEIDCLVGAVCMVRREVIEKVGTLDESIPIYAEDIDWCYRIRKAGWKIACFTDAEIIHLGQQTSQQIRVATQIASRKALYIYFRKHYCNAYILIVWILIKISSLLKYVLWGIISFITKNNNALSMRNAYKVLLITPLGAPINLSKFNDED